MKVKVWCKKCRGTGNLNYKYPTSHKLDCCPCHGEGYTEEDLYELDPNDSLPEITYLNTYNIAIAKKAQQDMLKAGFRKVKL